MVAAAGAGVFAPLKGYHFEDSPHVEYLGTLPDGLDKEVLVQKVTKKFQFEYGGSKFKLKTGAVYR